MDASPRANAQDPLPPPASGGIDVAMLPVTPVELSSGQTLNFAGISTRKFRLAWLGILALHGLCTFYFIANAHVYHRVPGSAIALTLETYNIGMAMSAFPTIRNVHAFFAGLHILLGAVMVVWSLWKRRLSFGPLQELALGDARRDSRHGPKVASTSQTSSFTSVVPARMRESTRLNAFVSTGGRVMKLIASLFSRQGFFGVEGKHFEEILAVREVVESVLQAYQAYRMSQSLPRPWLNRSYVGMLVVNCWMVPIIHFVYRRDVMLRRALSLLVDAVLDFTAAMVVPTVLLFSYASSFDTVSWGFPYTLYYDDTWFVKFLSEFPIMIVTSWGDLASRCVFSFGLISCIENTKELLREATSDQSSAHKGVTHRASLENAKQQQQQQNAQPPIAHRHPTAKLRVVSSFRQLRSKPLRSVLQFLQALCALLGAVVIVLHLYAESAVTLDECVIQVHPWLEPKPACVLLEWNCDAKHHTGEATDIAAQWSKASPALVRRLLVRHCPALEVPTMITQFHQLEAIKMYNTTIASWSVDAALTAPHHPNMFLAYFVRVNMSNSGKLPPGLATAPFPPKLMDIEFGISNLNSLPDDLSSTWPPFMTFACEQCEFTAIPKALHNMQPFWIAIGRNPISVFPFEIFAFTGLEIMGLTGTSLLPLVAPSHNESFLQDTTVQFLMMADSNITWLPRWVDTFIALPRTLWFMPPIDLTATPMCDAIAKMHAGTLDRFPVTWSASDELSNIMYVTSANVSALDSVIGCSALTIDAYPCAVDDALYMLGEK